MRNEDILEMIEMCELQEGEELITGKAYLFNQEFPLSVSGKVFYEYQELIVLVRNGIKVGGLYRMGTLDIHIVMNKRYEGKHIMSDFLRTGIVNKIWPENQSVELCNVYSWNEFKRKKHLAELCNMTVRNEEEIVKRLSSYDEKRKIYKEWREKVSKSEK